jgi:hypothetical protein
VWVKLDKKNLEVLPHVRVLHTFIANTVSQIKEPLVCVLVNANEDLQILCGAIANTVTVIDSQMIK